jgi:hypothetical protein
VSGEVLGSGLFVFGFLALALALVTFRHFRWLRLFQVLAFSLLSLGLLTIIAANAVQGRAIDFTRHLEWFEGADHPIKFWVSVVFHVVVCVGVLWATWASLKLPLGPMRGMTEGDLTPGFIGDALGQ